MINIKITFIFVLLLISFTFSFSQEKIIKIWNDKAPGAENCVDNLANARFLSDNIPPTFIIHAADDKVVPINTSIELFNNLHSLNIPVELHVFAEGGHGFGLGKEDEPNSNWTNLCEAWMKSQGFLTK